MHFNLDTAWGELSASHSDRFIPGKKPLVPTASLDVLGKSKSY
jgi:hypothetical protein